MEPITLSENIIKLLKSSHFEDTLLAISLLQSSGISEIIARQIYNMRRKSRNWSVKTNRENLGECNKLRILTWKDPYKVYKIKILR